MKKSDKVIWEWLLDNHSYAIGAEWSYYGGGFSRKDDISVDYEDIDWKKMRPLTDGSESAFTDTFHDPEWVSIMEGYLWLKDGTSYYAGFSVDGIDMLNEIVNYMVEKMGGAG